MDEGVNEHVGGEDSLLGRKGARAGKRFGRCGLWRCVLLPRVVGQLGLSAP